MIITFSGTGNSRYVAERLANQLGEQLVTIPSPAPYPQSPGEHIIWVFPVYSWGVPPVVRKYMKETRHLLYREQILVLTYGDDCGLAHEEWAEIIRRNDGTAGSCYGVQMPNSYVLMKGFDVDPESVAQDKLRKADSRIDQIGRSISRGEHSIDLHKGSFAWIKSKVINPWFVRFAMSPNPFHATNACNGCGKCERECPMGNIIVRGGRPAWRNNCALCLRCYHQCPKHAIAYGNATQGKGQYKGPGR